MKRKYKVKITPKLLKTLNKYWNMKEAIEQGYELEIAYIEKLMEKATGIKGIEFFRDDMGGAIVGIGNWQRTMPLVLREEL